MISLTDRFSGAAAATQPAWRASLFPLQSVRLLNGPFKEAQETDRTFLLAHNTDRLLAPFRREAGLPEKAPPYGNWESMGLDGHTAGHYLSALAMMYAATDDPELKRRMDYMVAELAECQKANGNGYVGGVPNSKELWAAVAAGKLEVTGFGINDRWVPWYNLHKIYAGVRDAHVIGHNGQARGVLVGMADWCGELLAHLSDAQVQQMLGAEHGGMNEVLADLSAITGDAKYLALARRFCDQAILKPLQSQQDELTGKHANTQIPKVIGFQQIAALDANAAGAAPLHRAAVFFWENVTGKRSVAIGGNSVNEHFHRVNDFTPMVEERTGPETCNTYNMLKLTEQLYEADPQVRFADFYERALFNHILSSQDPGRGGFVYFTPMRPRQYRVYSQAEKGFWCCVGTGFENHAKYGRFIYARHTADGEDALAVNLFIASELKWPERGLALTQETKFPDEPRTRLKLSLTGPKTFAVRVRHPDWVGEGELKISVNGEAQPIETKPSSYATISRRWADGDVVEVELPMRVAAERLPDGSGYVALRYGPVVLAARTGTEDMPGLFAGDGRGDHIAPGPLEPLYDAPMLVTDDPEHVADHMAPVAGAGPLTFAAAPDLIQPRKYPDLKLIPFFRLHEARYQIYWRVVTPENYAAERQRAQAEERERLLLDQATLDRVSPGEQQSEVDHNFKGEKTAQGSFQGRAWRDARGWFSYQMKAPPAGVPVDLLLSVYGLDRDRQFDVLVDEKKVAEVALDGQKGDTFYNLRYPLPERDVAGDAGRPITVKITAHDGSIAGGIFDLRLVRRQSLQSDEPQK